MFLAFWVKDKLWCTFLFHHKPETPLCCPLLHTPPLPQRGRVTAHREGSWSSGQTAHTKDPGPDCGLLHTACRQRERERERNKGGSKISPQPGQTDKCIACGHVQCNVFITYCIFLIRWEASSLRVGFMCYIKCIMYDRLQCIFQNNW